MTPTPTPKPWPDKCSSCHVANVPFAYKQDDCGARIALCATCEKSRKSGDYHTAWTEVEHLQECKLLAHMIARRTPANPA